MLGLVVDLGSIRMPQAGVGDEELNAALPSQEGEASVGVKKPLWGCCQLWGSKTQGEGCRVRSAMG